MIKMETRLLNYDGVNCLTMKQIAYCLNTTYGNVLKQFIKHRSYFEEQRDYYYLKGESLKMFKNKNNISSHTNELFLFTERGTKLFAKGIDTDEAWEYFCESTLKIENMYDLKKLLTKKKVGKSHD